MAANRNICPARGTGNPEIQLSSSHHQTTTKEIINKYAGTNTQWNQLSQEEKTILSAAGIGPGYWQDEHGGNAVDISGTPQDPAVYGSIVIGGWASGLISETGWGILYGCLRIGLCARIVAGTTGVTVYRVWGGDSLPDGHSWTPINPLTIEDYAAKAGLPLTNSGEYLSVGTINSMNDVTITNAAPILTNPGGLLEYLISNPEVQIIVRDIYYLVPPIK